MSTLPRPLATRTRSGDKEIKEITKKKKKNTFLISFHHFCRIFLQSFICSAHYRDGGRFWFPNSYWTYLAKIFSGNELGISCQKLWQLNTIHYSSSSSAFAWQSRTPSSRPSLARRPRRPQRPKRPRMSWSRLGGNLSSLLNLYLWRNPVMNDTNPMDN